MDAIRTSDGELIACRVEGPVGAPAVVLAHSLGTSMDLWRPQLAALSGRYRVVRFDMRGHGGSSVPGGDYTLDQLGRDVVDLLDALRLEQVAFCGVSLGGMVGQWLGIHAQDRVRALALCNTSAHLGPPRAWQERIAAVRAGGMSAVAAAVVERWFTSGFRDRAPDEVEAVRAMLLATPPAGYAGCCAAIRDMDLRGALRSIAVPALVVGGTADPATPPAHAKAIAEGIGGVRLVMLPAAHLANVEQPDGFNEALLAFLDEAVRS